VEVGSDDRLGAAQLPDAERGGGLGPAGHAAAGIARPNISRDDPADPDGRYQQGELGNGHTEVGQVRAGNPAGEGRRQSPAGVPGQQPTEGVIQRCAAWRPHPAAAEYEAGEAETDQRPESDQHHGAESDEQREFPGPANGLRVAAPLRGTGHAGTSPATSPRSRHRAVCINAGTVSPCSRRFRPRWTGAHRRCLTAAIWPSQLVASVSSTGRLA
jgi:hypothetical protein